MPTYKAPLRDMRFVLYELMNGEKITSLNGYEDFTRDLIDPVLEEAAKMCEEVLQPINRSGDEEGCRLENGVVYTPKGFKEAYTKFREGGWTSIACDPQYGGQGLPKIVNTIVLLARYPSTGRLVPQFGRRVRRFTCRPYLIYYRPGDETIEILHVFHGRRDQSSARGQ